MASYRKRSIEIEAFQWTIDEVPDWFREISGPFLINVQNGSVFIPTIEGTHEAREGDFILQGVKGELYLCKPDIFELTYEKVEDDML